MNREKKNGLMILIYAALIAACLGVVLLIGWLSSPPERGAESMTETEETGQPEETGEERVAGKETALPETEAEEQPETGGQEEIKAPEGEQKKEKPRGAGDKTEEAETETETEAEVYRPPTIVTLSDTHYFSPEMTDYGGAFEEMVKKDDGKVVPYLPQLLDALTEEMAELKPDAVVLSGDLTFNGERAGHEALAEKLRAMADAGIRVLVIPGNHDINNPHAASYFGAEREAAEGIDAEDFLEIYHEFGYDQALSRDETSLSYIYGLDERNWLMMLDSAQYDPINLVGGRLRGGTLSWMEEQLASAKEQGITVIPIAHHNLLKESILYPTDCTLENSAEVTALLERYRVPLYISGHLHLQRTKKYKPEPGEPQEAYHISEIVADSFAIPPCQYGILSWGEDGSLNYQTRETDVKGYAQRHGLTDGNLLNFDEYGMDFLVETVSRQIYQKMSALPEEHMQKMAGLYGWLNRAYCAGTPIDAKEVRTDEAYRLWERNLPDSRMFEEIDAILRDTGEDHNAWESGREPETETPPLQDISHHDIMMK